MAYQALYRKYRPRTFADVRGQEQIVATLKTELRTGRISHAYLFCGTRGTGKTTCAKIFAKAVNCLNPQDGEPCNECRNCREIDSGSNLDILEIDAASNNGVDNIRDIRDEVVYSPASGKRRVYIIDEVHMLSQGAFNALLKTLEEPPPYVLFILATTEAHKIPATIISRCQRFDFRRISQQDITDRVLEVAEREQIPIEADAARLIARLADGALRDAMSILDQCACTGEHITYEFVARTAGVTDTSHTLELAEHLAKKDYPGALQAFAALYQSNREPSLVCQELLSLYRDLMLLKSVKEPDEVLLTPPDRQPQLKPLAELLTLEELLNGMGVLQDTLDGMGRSLSPRTAMETALLRLCRPAVDTTPQALLARIAALEQKLSEALAGGIEVRSAPAPEKAPVEEAAKPVAAPKPTPEEPGPGSRLPTDQDAPFWSDVIARANSSAYKGILKGFLEDTRAAEHGETLTVIVENELKLDLFQKPDVMKDLKILVNAVTGRFYKIEIIKPKRVEKEDDALLKLAERAKALGDDSIRVVD